MRACGCVLDPVVFWHMGCALSPPRPDPVTPCAGPDCREQHAAPGPPTLAELAQIVLWRREQVMA